MCSHPRTIKSWFALILNESTSGTDITTFGFPPYRGNLASMSPKVRVTDSLPGKTRYGPKTVYSVSPFKSRGLTD